MAMERGQRIVCGMQVNMDLVPTIMMGLQPFIRKTGVSLTPEQAVPLSKSTASGFDMVLVDPEIGEVHRIELTLGTPDDTGHPIISLWPANGRISTPSVPTYSTGTSMRS